MEKLIFLIPLFPFIGFLLNGILGNRFGKSFVTYVGCGTVGLSFLVSLGLFFEILGRAPEARVLNQVLWSWIAVDTLSIDLSFMVDQLSVVMIMVVTGVGFLIHIYSTGYMHHDKSYWRFFAYLNMFVFFMSLLVLGGNYIVMFVGWEGVGLASYLLIGFWYEGMPNADAGKKAFVVNRIGDFGFVLGLFLLFVNFGTLSYGELFPKVAHAFDAGSLAMNSPLMIAACLLLFVGATGKSAQIPLYVWLPDAMAGPTPVSALIHAATMVTAGVYMVARSNILFTIAPTALMIVAGIAALTALMAATIGILQNDIKKVLAYSTVSQLGYMFIGVSMTAYTAGVFHLMTHAFFKACLFLCSGSVIHAMGGEQDIRKMGGLYKKLPITYITMLLATIAIAGIPPFSGFFSKDEILWKAFTFPYAPVFGKVIWFIGACGAGITAFYMFRMIFMTFHGEFRGDEHTRQHLHESPFSMTIPLMILAFLSVTGGFLGVPHIIGDQLGHFPNYFEEFLHPVFQTSHNIIHNAVHAPHPPVFVEWGLMALSVLIAITGITIAYNIYMKKYPALPAKLAEDYPDHYTLIYNKYFVDELYELLVVKPIYYLSRFFWKVVDVIAIDTICVNGPAKVIYKFGEWIGRVHNGYLQTYGSFVVVGLLVILSYILIIQ